LREGLFSPPKTVQEYLAGSESWRIEFRNVGTERVVSERSG